MTPETNPILLGQLLGIALACGLNLYAVITVLGLASLLGWTGALPLELRGVEHWIVIASAAVLYLVELAIDKVPYLDFAWDAVHTVIRPLAAGLLAVLALTSLPLGAQLAGGVGAAAAALLTHTSKAGLRVALNTSGRRRLAIRVSVAEDLIAAALVVIVLLLPLLATVLAIASCIVLAVTGPPLWRAAWLGARGLDGRLRAFFGSPGWRERDDLPAPVARLVEPDELGISPPRATRAAADRLPGAGSYRNGWLVIQRNRVAFVYRSFLGPRRIEVPPLPVTEVRAGVLADAVRLDGANGFTLFLLKDGPPLDVAAADLRSASQ